MVSHGYFFWMWPMSRVGFDCDLMTNITYTEVGEHLLGDKVVMKGVRVSEEWDIGAKCACFGGSRREGKI